MIKKIHQDLLDSAARFSTRLNQDGQKLGEARQCLALLKSTLELISSYGFNSMLATETMTRLFFSGLRPPIRSTEAYRAYIHHIQNHGIQPMDYVSFLAMGEDYFDSSNSFFTAKKIPDQIQNQLGEQKLISG